MKTGCNFISGAWQPALSGATYTTRNPADLRQEVGEYPRSGEADAQAAIAAAAGAFPGWRDLTAVARGRLLSQASNILAQRKQAVAEAITIEIGWEAGLLPPSPHTTGRTVPYHGGWNETLVFRHRL